jgi:hypothetical protein
MGGGYDIGASFAGSASSGAANSGATSGGGGGGTKYIVGGNGLTPTQNWGMIALLGSVVVFVGLIFLRR